MLPLCVEESIRQGLPLCSVTLRTFVRKVTDAIEPKTRKLTEFTGKPETPESGEVEVYIRPVLPLCSGTLRTFVRKVTDAIEPQTRKLTKFTGKPETPESGESETDPHQKEESQTNARAQSP